MRRDKMTIRGAANRVSVITEVLNELEGREYRLKFRREATCLYCFELQALIMPEDFTVDEAYFFEEISNPDEDRMLYAISSSGGVKGFLIDTCGVYMDNISQEMMEKLQSKPVITPSKN